MVEQTIRLVPSLTLKIKTKNNLQN